MDTDRILTLHPRGLQGTRIDADKYEFIRDEILVRLAEHEQPFMELARQMVDDLQETFDGSVAWYATTVKLDLEARGLIASMEGTTPPLLFVCEMDMDE